MQSSKAKTYPFCLASQSQLDSDATTIIVSLNFIAPIPLWGQTQHWGALAIEYILTGGGQWTHIASFFTPPALHPAICYLIRVRVCAPCQLL